MSKIEGNILTHPEELVHTSETIPKNPDRFFNYFTKQMESKVIQMLGYTFQIMEMGPKKDLSTKFQVLGLSQAETDFTVRFEILEGKLNAYYGFRMGIFSDSMNKRMMRKALKNSLKTNDKRFTPVLISYIKNLTSKSLDYINSAPEPIAKPSDISQATGSGKILVFVSYATKDAPSFRIEEIADELSKTEEIADVLYWQEDNKDNIIEYMNENLAKCDVVLLFCSPNSLNSGPVQKEWTAAEGLNKPIIPVFLNTEHIPPLLNTREGFKFDPFDFEKNIEKMYKLIVKKSLIIH